MAVEQQSRLQQSDRFAFPVRFSVGTKPKAEVIGDRLERASSFLAGVFAFTPTVRLLVLGEEDWSDHAAFPLYGMPHTAEGTSIIVSATRGAFWDGVLQNLDDILTLAQRAEALTVYGDNGGNIDMTRFADLIAIHELGHLFHEQVPFNFPRLWLMELFANLCVVAYLAEEEPQALRLWTMLPERMMAVPADRVPHRSLDDFERLYVCVGAENYCWYQFRLVSAAEKFYAATGIDGLRRLYDTFATNQHTLTDEELARLLAEQVHPTFARVMTEWDARTAGR